MRSPSFTYSFPPCDTRGARSFFSKAQLCQCYIGNEVIYVAEQGPKLAARSCGGRD